MHRYVFACLLIASAGCRGSVVSSPPRSSGAGSAVQPDVSAAARTTSDPRSPIGCYRADRPLGTAASVTGGFPTPGLATFRLLPDGRLDRPGVGAPEGFTEAMAASARRTWAEASRWQMAGDTLRIRLSTWTSGWDVELVPALADTGRSYVGVARYLTDVVVTDTAAWQPPSAAVRVWPEPCAQPA